MIDIKDIKPIHPVPSKRLGRVKMTNNYYDAKRHLVNAIKMYRQNDAHLNKELAFTKHFERFLTTLNNDEYFVLDNDFYSKQENPKWYLKFWSLSTYMKIKRSLAMKYVGLK